jgi:hypothetical protein
MVSSNRIGFLVWVHCHRRFQDSKIPCDQVLHSLCVKFVLLSMMWFSTASKSSKASKLSTSLRSDLALALLWDMQRQYSYGCTSKASKLSTLKHSDLVLELLAGMQRPDADDCWRMLTYAIYMNMYVYVDICYMNKQEPRGDAPRSLSCSRRMLTYADVCWRMLTYADIYSWRMLTYAHRGDAMAVAPRAPKHDPIQHRHLCVREGRVVGGDTWISWLDWRRRGLSVWHHHLLRPYLHLQKGTINVCLRYVCPHTTMYVLIILCICVIILLYMCPHTSMCVF